jgi:hypothetical protein
MYASIRTYRLDRGDMGEVMQRIDRDFADGLAGEQGFAGYHVVDCGDGVLCTVTVFHDAASAERSNDMAAEFVREHLKDMDISRTDVKSGKVAVNRAASEMLEPAHA